MNADGTWQLSIDSPVGKQNVSVFLITDGDQLGGSVVNLSNNISSDIFDGQVDGSTLRWKVKMQQLKLTLAFATTMQGDAMTGKVKAGIFGYFSVVGNRIS